MFLFAVLAAALTGVVIALLVAVARRDQQLRDKWVFPRWSIAAYVISLASIGASVFDITNHGHQLAVVSWAKDANHETALMTLSIGMVVAGVMMSRRRASLGIVLMSLALIAATVAAFAGPTHNGHSGGPSKLAALLLLCLLGGTVLAMFFRPPRMWLLTTYVIGSSAVAAMTYPAGTGGAQWTPRILLLGLLLGAVLVSVPLALGIPLLGAGDPGSRLGNRNHALLNGYLCFAALVSIACLTAHTREHFLWSVWYGLTFPVGGWLLWKCLPAFFWLLSLFGVVTGGSGGLASAQSQIDRQVDEQMANERARKAKSDAAYAESQRRYHANNAYLDRLKSRDSSLSSSDRAKYRRDADYHDRHSR